MSSMNVIPAPRPRLVQRVMAPPDMPEADPNIAPPEYLGPRDEPTQPLTTRELMLRGLESGASGQPPNLPTTPGENAPQPGYSGKQRLLEAIMGGAGGAVRGMTQPQPTYFTGKEWAESPEYKRAGQEELMQHQEKLEGMRESTQERLADARLAEMMQLGRMRDTGATQRAELGQSGAMQRAELGQSGAMARAQLAQTSQDRRLGQTLSSRAGIEASKEQSAWDRLQSNIAARRAISDAQIASRADIARLHASGMGNLSPVERRMRDMAITTIPHLQQALQETQRVASDLGPLVGRWNDFWTRGVGAPNAEFAHYMDEMTYLESAITLAHSQGRVSNLIYEQFQKMFAAGKQSPENMMQALQVSIDWMNSYANFGTPQMGQGQGGHAPSPNSPTPNPDRTIILH